MPCDFLFFLIFMQQTSNCEPDGQGEMGLRSLEVTQRSLEVTQRSQEVTLLTGCSRELHRWGNRCSVSTSSFIYARFLVLWNQLLCGVNNVEVEIGVEVTADKDGDWRTLTKEMDDGSKIVAAEDPKCLGLLKNQ